MLDRPDFNWTDDAVETLKRHWQAGLSCSLIATEMGGGLTRNSIIGKVTRLKLPKRTQTMTTAQRSSNGRAARAAIKPVRKEGNQHGGLSFKLAQARKDRLSMEEGLEAVFGRPSVERVLGDDVPADRQLISLLELTERTCRWPYGDPHRPGFGFCGCRKGRDAGPYCPEHTEKSEAHR